MDRCTHARPCDPSDCCHPRCRESYTLQSKPTGMPRTDKLFHELSAPHYGETAMERRSRVEYALLQLCAQLESELIKARGVAP